MSTVHSNRKPFSGLQERINVSSYIDWKALHKAILSEIEAYNQGLFTDNSQRYYHLMALLHSLRSLHLAGLCQPTYIQYCKRLAKCRRSHSRH